MAIKDLRVAGNEYVPEKDVIERKEDGREIVIARGGTPMPMQKAVDLGLVKGQTTEAEGEKSAGPDTNKAEGPKSNKATTDKSKKDGEK